MTDINTNQTKEDNSEIVKEAKANAVKEQKLAVAREKQIAKLKAKKAKLEAKLAKAPGSKKETIKYELTSVTHKLEAVEAGKGKRPAKLVLKTWSKGLSKETSRITWERKTEVVKDFVTIVVISVILAALFFVVDLIIISLPK